MPFASIVKGMAFLRRQPALQDFTDTVLTESVEAGRVDTDAGIIRHVKVLGRSSENGRDYSRQAIQDACRLYEGTEVNVDHPRGKSNTERGMREGWAVLKGCTIADDGVYADLHYLREHSETPVLLERVNRGFPIGLSHNAKGKLSTKRGRTIVEGIAKVHSVDLVRRPATNRNLFEEQTMETTTLRDLIEGTGYKHTRKLIEALPGEVDPMAPVEVPVDTTGEPSADSTQVVVDTLAQEAAKIIADPAIDEVSTIKKVKSIVKTIETVKADLGPDTPEPASSPADVGDKKSGDMAESITEAIKFALAPITKQLGEVQIESFKNKALAENGVVLRNLREDMKQDLAKQTTKKGVTDLIESWAPAFRGFAQPSFTPSNGETKKKHVPLFKMARR